MSLSGDPRVTVVIDETAQIENEAVALTVTGQTVAVTVKSGAQLSGGLLVSDNSVVEGEGIDILFDGTITRTTAASDTGITAYASTNVRIQTGSGRAWHQGPARPSAR